MVCEWRSHTLEGKIHYSGAFERTSPGRIPLTRTHSHVIRTIDDKQAYRPVEDRYHLGELLLEYLEEYNMEFPSQMHLVFFADAVAHVSRICRVLRQPRGNALLVGVGGG